jgi:DNA-binding NtrC family response regulator
MADILVVDDDQSVASAFERFLKLEGHECRLASTAADALRLMEDRRPDLVILDNRMPGTSGLEALPQFRVRFPGLCIVLMTGYGTSQTSIDAIRSGAFDYLTKPPDLDDLRRVIDRALTSRPSPGHPRDEHADEAPSASLVGDTPAMLELYKMIGRLATNDVPALIVGERGTGKHLVAATLHDSSPRRDRPLVVLDCALPEAVVERELFWNGSQAGTLHLAHIDKLPRALQVRLARALSTDKARGATERIEARVVASTDRDLADAVAAGAFDRDLYDAIGLITLRLPPLRERRDDIPLLVRQFVKRLNAELGRSIQGVEAAAEHRLAEYAWPGNVGELWRVLRRAAIVARSDLITNDDVGTLTEAAFAEGQDADAALARAARAALLERLVASTDGVPATPFHDVVDVVEAALVKEALSITNGNQMKAAELLGVNRATLRKKASSD